MHGASTHLALAGSVLVMGTVGAVTAVHLEPYPVPTNGTWVGAEAPMVQPPTLSTPDARPPAAAPAARPAVRDTGHTRAARRATVEREVEVEVEDDDRPVRARDLIDLAAAPDTRETVLLGRGDLERAAALKLVSRVARGELLGVPAGGLRIGRLGAVRLDLDDVAGSGGRHHRSGHAHRAGRLGVLHGVLDGVLDGVTHRSGGRHRA